MRASGDIHLQTELLQLSVCDFPCVISTSGFPVLHFLALLVICPFHCLRSLCHAAWHSQQTWIQDLLLNAALVLNYALSPTRRDCTSWVFLGGGGRRGSK